MEFKTSENINGSKEFNGRKLKKKLNAVVSSLKYLKINRSLDKEHINSLIKWSMIRIFKTYSVSSITDGMKKSKKSIIPNSFEIYIIIIYIIMDRIQ